MGVHGQGNAADYARSYLWCILSSNLDPLWIKLVDLCIRVHISLTSSCALMVLTAQTLVVVYFFKVQQIYTFQKYRPIDLVVCPLSTHLS